MLYVCNARRLGHPKDKIVLRRHSDVFKFERIEFNARLAEELLQELSADEMADGETVGFGYFKEVVRRNQSPRPGHVVNDDARFPGNILAEVAGNKASVRIVPTSWRGAHDNSDCFPFIERLSAVSELLAHK